MYLYLNININIEFEYMTAEELNTLKNALTDAIADGFGKIPKHDSKGRNISDYTEDINEKARETFLGRMRNQERTDKINELKAERERLNSSDYGKTRVGKKKSQDLTSQIERLENGGISKQDVMAGRAEMIKAVASVITKIGDNVTNLIFTLQRNGLELTKNNFDLQLKLAKAELQFTKIQATTATKTYSQLTSQNATDAAFGIYKASSNEAVSKIDYVTSKQVAQMEFTAAEYNRITKKFAGMAGAINGIAASLVTVGLALAPATSGLSLAISAVGALVAVGFAATNWIQGFRKVTYERLQQQKEMYKDIMNLADEEVKAIANVVSEFDDVVKDFTDYIRKNDTLYKQTGVLLGYTGDSYSKYARQISSDVAKIFGTTAEQELAMMKSYMDTSDRATIMDAEDYNNIVATSRVFGISESEAGGLYGSMNIFNQSIEAGAEVMTGMYKTGTKMGLNIAKASKNFQQNMKLAEKYNFKGGVENMAKLTLWAQQTRFNIQSAASFADKLMNGSLSDVLETSAKLQVLGGSAAMYSDPMAMMYEAGANVGALAKRQAAMFNDIKGTFNAKTGETEFSWYENRLLNERAKAAGLNPEDVRNQIRQKDRVRQVGRILGSGVSDDVKTAIGNRAKFHNGKWEVDTINGKKNVQELAGMTPEQLEKILLPETQEETIVDIAKNVRSIAQKEEAEKESLRAGRQEELYSSVIELSEKAIKAQEIIFGDKEFVQNAKDSMRAVGDNALVQAQATVDAFHEFGPTIRNFRDYVQQQIVVSKTFTEHMRLTMSLLEERGVERFSALEVAIQKIQTSAEGNKAQYAKALWDSTTDPNERKKIEDAFKNYNINWSKEQKNMWQKGIMWNASYTDLWNTLKDKDVGVGEKVGALLLNTLDRKTGNLRPIIGELGKRIINNRVNQNVDEFTSVNDGTVDIRGNAKSFVVQNGRATRIAKNDNIFAAKNDGPFASIINEILPGLRMLVNGKNYNSGKNLSELKVVFDGEIKVSQDGTSINLVDMMKNDPSITSQFTRILKRAVEVNSGGKPQKTYYV